MGLGNLHYVDDRLEAALNHYQHALDLYRKIDDRQGQANTLRRLDDSAPLLDD